MKRPILLFAVVALLALLAAPSCRREKAGSAARTPAAGTAGTPAAHRSFAPPPTIAVPTARPGEPTRLPELPG
jgi:hypothetical protein